MKTNNFQQLGAVIETKKEDYLNQCKSYGKIANAKPDSNEVYLADRGTRIIPVSHVTKNKHSGRVVIHVTEDNSYDMPEKRFGFTHVLSKQDRDILSAEIIKFRFMGFNLWSDKENRKTYLVDYQKEKSGDRLFIILKKGEQLVLQSIKEKNTYYLLSDLLKKTNEYMKKKVGLFAE